MRRRAGVAGLALMVAVLGGCERGCLSRWLADRRVAAERAPAGRRPSPPTRGSGPSGDRAGLSLSAVDCPDGMARCAEGIVQASRAYHYAEPCTASPELCQCPWERLGDCPRGCAAEGALVDVPRDRALAQLCAPIPAGVDADSPFAAPPPPNALAPACDAPFLCDRGLVVACGPPPRVVGACTAGCSREGQTLEPEDDAPTFTAEAALAVLCRR